ncbi:MAG: glycine cleavage system aminomethyltransferase GcvT [Nocardioidaceae bacterium]
MSLLRSPLHDRHLERGAKTAEFGGWEMPLEYAGGGVLKEHAAVRERVGLFDVSHLGKALVQGPDAAAYVNRCLTNDLGKITAGQAQYTLCCDDDTGGVVDDLIAYLRSDAVFLIPNAANTADVVARLEATAPDGIEVVNRHRDYAVLALQGPNSDEVLSEMGLPVGHAYMSFVEVPFAGEPLIVCRTGYTGERGYELVAPNTAAGELWDGLLSVGQEYGILPCGLGARDTLRTEMGYPLHGQDISLEVTPVQARLGWAVGWKKPEFWGREALTAEKAAGPRRSLVGLSADGRGIPRPHMDVVNADGEVVGEVTSGTFSPTLRRGIGLALVRADLAASATPADGVAARSASAGSTDAPGAGRVFVDVRGHREAFDLTRPPFVDTSVRDS